jgi:hypothetical protein
MKLLPVTWIDRQLAKCDELLALEDLSDDNRALVQVLKRDFEEQKYQEGLDCECDC